MKAISLHGLVRGTVAVVLMAAMLAGAAPVTMAKGGDDPIKIRIRLKRTGEDAYAKGKAIYVERGDRRKVNIEVEHVTSATSVEFIVDGQSLGTLPVVLGMAELELNSKDGDNPPVMTINSSVDVLDADTGVPLLTAN